MNALGAALARARSRTWASVDLDAVAHNVRAIRSLLPEKTAFMAVVKADAYGHGLVPVSEAALAAGASWLGVVTPGEAAELLAAGVRARTLVLGPVSAGWLPRFVDSECRLTVGTFSALEAVQSLDGKARFRVHIKVDTGMTRMGVTVEELAGLLTRVDSSKAEVEGIFTHMACANAPDPAPTQAQFAAFEQAVALVRERFPLAIAHAAASAATFAYPEAHLDMVRIGISLYGVAPAPHLTVPALRPVMTLSSRVTRTRRVPEGTPVSYCGTYRTPKATTIATVGLGYADGYPRVLGNTGHMLVGGRRLPVAGRVCMDYTMLDAGDAPVCEGDEVIVFGPGLPVDEVSEAAGTIAHEVFCRVGRRVPRVYLRDGHSVAVAGVDPE
ncbi:MAG: alanine racemase [Armatimonadetes bacterium]|nr:alanine racemase [Armatimonadota bacterium]